MGLHPVEVVSTALLETGKTLVRHYVHAEKEQAKVPARKQLLFDEAFHISKAFLERAMNHSVESIQLFGQAKIPSPPWVGVHKVSLPIEVSNDAASILIDCLGEEDIEHVVGGRQWWQQRAAKPGVGVQAEWIWIKSQWQASRKQAAMKEHHKAHKDHAREDDCTDDEYTANLDDQRCLYYIHGGGYYFGSIDVYRYTIWRYARKINGRAFTLKYRLAPQYPFPCALHDALAGYLWLIRPPPEAQHKPVDPQRLVIMGDSAGGGLTLALLCLLRDLKLPLPAGGVLVSPWLDLTHSFPSILQNTATDIIPPYGFLHKPSVLWPPPSADEQAKIQGYTSITAIKEREASRQTSRSSSALGSLKDLFISAKDGTPGSSKPAKNQPSVENGGEVDKHGSESAASTKPITKPHGNAKLTHEPESYNDVSAEHKSTDKTHESSSTANTGKNGTENRTEPDHFIELEIDGKTVTLKDQIQFYALNSQLTHPYVSPVLQPSLGGLPELLVIAGDNEVLRDEAIYAAHRAAHPGRYPLREPLLKANEDRTELAKSYGPTKVHLQIFDDMPHDLVIFSMANSANFAYRSIASFCKAVTASPAERREKSLAPIAELDPDILSKSPLQEAPEDVLFRHGRLVPPPSRPPITKKEAADLDKTIYSPWYPFHRPEYVDNMVRERVGIDGTVRPLEPAADLQACCMKPDEIGLIKEAPVKRYLEGKSKWDKKYPAKRIENRRKRNVKQAAKYEAKKIAKGALRKDGKNKTDGTADPGGRGSVTAEEEEFLGTWAKIDGERPPPSSIAARRDTTEALNLASRLQDEPSRRNPLTLWAGMHDLAQLFPEKMKRSKKTADDPSGTSSSGSSES